MVSFSWRRKSVKGFKTIDKVKIRIRFNIWGNFVAYHGRRKIFVAASLWSLVGILRRDYGADLTFTGDYAGEAKEISERIDKIEKGE